MRRRWVGIGTAEAKTGFWVKSGNRDGTRSALNKWVVLCPLPWSSLAAPPPLDVIVERVLLSVVPTETPCSTPRIPGMACAPGLDNLCSSSSSCCCCSSSSSCTTADKDVRVEAWDDKAEAVR